MFQLCLTLGKLYYIYSFEIDCKSIRTTEKNTEDGENYWWLLFDLKGCMMG